MGLFSFNYSKPGPGVDKDAPQKKGIFRYLEIFGRKFWKLLQANMLTFLCSLPFMIILFIIAPINPDALTSLMPEAASEDLAVMHLMLRFLYVSLVYFLWGSGPASAGYAYIARSFTREQHSWIFSDFKDKFKENFKQGMIVSIIDLVLSYASVFGIYFYYSAYARTGNKFFFAAFCVMCMVLLLYTFMHFYIYQFMVTFAEKTSQLYKNSLIFAISQLPMCVLLLAVVVVISYLMFSYLQPLFAMLLNFIIGLALMRFPIEYSAARAIEKKLLPRAATITYDEEDEGEN